MSVHFQIVLFGFMGVGKTTVGKKIAQKLSWEFVDMDQVIEHNFQMTISQIFEKMGEDHFRKIERDLVIQLCQRKNIVIATGGGVILDQRNVDNFSEKGLCICLKDEMDVIYSRVKHYTHRPLLQVDNLYEALQTLYHKREAMYQKIDIQVYGHQRSADQVAEEILKIKRENEQLGEV